MKTSTEDNHNLQQWPLESIGDRKDMGVLKGLEIRGHGSIANGPQYLVATFEQTGGIIVSYRIDAKKTITQSTVELLKNAMCDILNQFASYGGVNGPNMVVEVKSEHVATDLFNKGLNACEA